MKKLLLLVPLLCLPTIVGSQTTCFEYAGGVISCDSASGNTTITPFSRNQGVIQGDRYGQSYMEPYTIIRPEPRRDSFSSRTTEPLPPLDRLDRLDRHDNAMRDPLDSPLFLGK